MADTEIDLEDSEFDLELDSPDEDDLEIESDEESVVIEGQAGWVGTHPAEIAAAKIRKTTGNSDEGILRDLRKGIFTIPLLKQEQLLPLFGTLDNIILGIVRRITNSSDKMRDKVLDVIIKVAAGNTYNKNIYEKDSSSLEKRPRTTFKDHEIEFMSRSYNLMRAIRKSDSVAHLLQDPLFIRGIYEEILTEFITITKDYTRNHHLALQARLANDTEKYYKHFSECTRIENLLRMRDNHAYSIIRDAEQANRRYIEVRSVIIAPYLRSVFSLAKNLGKNVQQTLDNFQNGSMGLIRAVSCYSTVRPTSFSSVAKGWIKQTMLLSIKEEANFVKLPIATWQSFTAMERVRLKNGIEIENYEEIAKINDTTLEKVKQIYESVKLSQVYSIHKTYDQNEKLTLEDVIPNEEPDSDDEMLDDLRDYIGKAGLTVKEKKVLALSYGLSDVISNDKVSRLDSESERLVQLARYVGFDVRLLV